MTLDELYAGQVLLIDKPLDWTSFDLVNKLRWHIKKQFDTKSIKVGHAGTLDPKATGLLILCIGRATKQIAHFQNLDKTYTGTLKLGATTPSSDVETAEDARFPLTGITRAALLKAAAAFRGEQLQRPPLYSAVKQGGKRLYEWARAGAQTEIKPRPVYISEFNIQTIELPFVKFQVHCGKGTYIRSLARDFGEALHNGAYLTELRRTRIGPHALETAWTLETALKALKPGPGHGTPSPLL